MRLLRLHRLCSVPLMGAFLAASAGQAHAQGRVVAYEVAPGVVGNQEFGGSLSAPGWIEIAAWWQHAKAYDDQDRTALRRYAFLDDLLPTAARPWPLRRAVPTIGFRRT